MKLFFETNLEVFDEYIRLIDSLIKDHQINKVMILFNKQGMRIHRETDLHFVLCASWEKDPVFNNYQCNEEIQLLLNIEDMLEYLISFKMNLDTSIYKVIQWSITPDDDDNLLLKAIRI